PRRRCRAGAPMRELRGELASGPAIFGFAARPSLANGPYPQASHTPDAGRATKQVGQILGGRSSRLIGRRDCVLRLALATRSRIAAALAAALARAASSASVMTSAGTSSA